MTGSSIICRVCIGFSVSCTYDTQFNLNHDRDSGKNPSNTVLISRVCFLSFVSRYACLYTAITMAIGYKGYIHTQQQTQSRRFTRQRSLRRTITNTEQKDGKPKITEHRAESPLRGRYACYKADTHDNKTQSRRFTSRRSPQKMICLLLLRLTHTVTKQRAEGPLRG